MKPAADQLTIGALQSQQTKKLRYPSQRQAQLRRTARTNVQGKAVRRSSGASAGSIDRVTTTVTSTPAFFSNLLDNCIAVWERPRHRIAFTG
jgi:hypothetical protein